MCSKISIKIDEREEINFHDYHNSELRQECPDILVQKAKDKVSQQLVCNLGKAVI